jgi:cardiolipin synthase
MDAMMRFSGPVVRQNQHLFASDWMAHVAKDPRDILREPLPPGEPGFTAQVINTGPTVRYPARLLPRRRQWGQSPLINIFPKVAPIC